jgi:hypothetical protein
LAFLRETLGLTVEGDLDPTGYTKMAQVSLALDWPYVKNHWLQPWFGYLYVHLPNVWLDSTHPSFAGRGG